MIYKLFLNFLLIHLAITQVYGINYSLERLYKKGENLFITNTTQVDSMTKIIGIIQMDLNRFSIDFEMQKDNLTECILLSRDQTIGQIKNLIINAPDCKAKIKYDYEMFLNSFVKGHKHKILKESQFVNCIHINQTCEFLKCIDARLLKNKTDVEIYEKSVELLYNYNNIISLGIDSCQVDVKKSLINTLINSTKQINQCIENFNESVYSMLPTNIIKEAPLNWYKSKKSSLKLAMVKSRRVIQEFKWNATAYYTTVIDHIRNTNNISVHCCFYDPEEKNYLTSQNAINKIDKCLGNLTEKFESFIASIIEDNPRITRITRICYGTEFENAENVFLCLEAVWLYDPKYYDEIYSKVSDKLKTNRRSLSSEIYGCLHPAVHEFTRRIIFENVLFDNCVENQGLNFKAINKTFHFHKTHNQTDLDKQLATKVIHNIFGGLK